MPKQSKTKAKIQLSENLKLGVAAPASQSAFFKYGGVVFLALSLFLMRNIYTTLKDNGFSRPKIATSSQLQQQVLGAYDQKNSTTTQITTYIVQKGDTIFMIAQSKQIDWQIIATLNHLKPPYAIKFGQSLKLPLINQN